MVMPNQAESVLREKVARLFADYEAAIYCGQANPDPIRVCLSESILKLYELDPKSAEGWMQLTWDADQSRNRYGRAQ